MAVVGEEVERFGSGGDIRHIGERLLHRGAAPVAPVGGDGVFVGVRAAHVIREVCACGGAEGRAVPGHRVVGHRLHVCHGAGDAE